MLLTQLVWIIFLPCFWKMLGRNTLRMQGSMTLRRSLSCTWCAERLLRVAMVFAFFVVFCMSAVWGSLALYGLGWSGSNFTRLILCHCTVVVDLSPLDSLVCRSELHVLWSLPLEQEKKADQKMGPPICIFLGFPRKIKLWYGSWWFGRWSSTVSLCLRGADVPNRCQLQAVERGHKRRVQVGGEKFGMPTAIYCCARSKRKKWLTNTP